MNKNDPTVPRWSITKRKIREYNKEFEADNGLVSGVDGAPKERWDLVGVRDTGLGGRRDESDREMR